MHRLGMDLDQLNGMNPTQCTSKVAPMLPLQDLAFLNAPMQ
jgi:hypothetical protein